MTDFFRSKAFENAPRRRGLGQQEVEGDVVFRANTPDGEVLVFEVSPGTFAVRAYSVVRFAEGGSTRARILPDEFGTQGLYTYSMMPDVIDRFLIVMGSESDIEIVEDRYDFAEG